jgi:hypothetical protein
MATDLRNNVKSEIDRFIFVNYKPWSIKCLSSINRTWIKICSTVQDVLTIGNFNERTVFEVRLNCQVLFYLNISIRPVSDTKNFRLQFSFITICQSCRFKAVIKFLTML